MRYQVYILRNVEGKRYIGLSENIKKRLEDHNLGLSKWTSRHRPWELIWASAEMGLSAARKLENKLKKQKGGLGLTKLMTEMGS